MEEMGTCRPLAMTGVIDMQLSGLEILKPWPQTVGTPPNPAPSVNAILHAAPPGIVEPSPGFRRIFLPAQIGGSDRLR